MKNLKNLLDQIQQHVGCHDAPSIRITGVTQDSRQVLPGNVFVAVRGGQMDGHRYIVDAIQRGAVAVVGTESIHTGEIPYIQVEDSRLALAWLAAAFYDFPASNMTMIGVTGTDGKTTTSNLIYQILISAGIATGMVSTVNALIGTEIVDTGFHVTTPEAPDIQRYLAQMVDANLTHAVLEVTSHGLDQHRVTACEFDIAVMTNVTHEHLDYHGSYEAYRSTKGQLFSSLAITKPKSFQPPTGAVLNRDDGSYTYLQGLVKNSLISYGLGPEAQIRATNLRYLPEGMRFDVHGRDVIGSSFELPFYTKLIGEYNVANCLAAIAVTLGILRLNPAHVQQGIASLRIIPGRMETIRLLEMDPDKQDFTAIVDFAHTPNALRRSLETARQMTSGRVIVVFGSAGLRDRAKRRMMAEVAAELADITILTAEDPRTESLEAILAEMASGMIQHGASEGQKFWRIADRGEAIQFAVDLARSCDLVIACGKGHEQSMCFGETEYPWDDRVAMQAAIAERYGYSGPKMPYLPTQ
jgi:UDP-N-acetylmuramoyl-L-alanyl-D-glutamate--2,6-diaminopimelate ligase